MSILRRLMAPLHYCKEFCGSCKKYFCTVSGSHTTHRCDRCKLLG